MANFVNPVVIQDGARNCIINIEGILDTSDLTNYAVIDPALLWPIDLGYPAQILKIKRVQYKVEPLLEVRLLWDATVPTNAAVYTGSGHDEYTQQFPNTAGVGRTGKILITTQGWTGGSILSFNLTLELVKHRVPADPAVGGLTFANYQSSGLIATLPL